MPVRAVFFDVVGTLLHPNPSAAEVYANVGRRFGSRLDRAEVARRFRAAFEQQETIDRANSWRTSEQREVERWRTIVGEVLDDVTDPAACFETLYEHFAEPKNWRSESDAPGVFAALRERSVQLGLASNYDQRLHRVLAGFPELATVQHVVISSEVGWRKPAPEFFAALSTISGVACAEILHIGDDEVNDYQGALAAGCQAALYDPATSAPTLTRRVRRLSDLQSKGSGFFLGKSS